MTSNLDALFLEGVLNRIKAEHPQVEIKFVGGEIHVIYPPIGLDVRAYITDWDPKYLYAFEEEVSNSINISLYGGEYFDPGLNWDDNEEFSL